VSTPLAWPDPPLADDAIRLRPFEPTDLALVRAASEDPYIPLITTVPWVYSDAEATAYLARQHQRLANGVGWSLAIADRDSGAALGGVGLWPRDATAASFGYFVIPECRGRALAARAVRLLAAWAFGRGFERLELSVEPWNVASQRTAERAGFRQEALLRSLMAFGGVRRDLWMYGRLPDDPAPGGSIH
jgi:[ribosomal protein S5]-alanine N-acetyltransferase